MGETALDEETFNDYLAEMRTHYTADKVGYFCISSWPLKRADAMLVPSSRHEDPRPTLLIFSKISPFSQISIATRLPMIVLDS